MGLITQQRILRNVAYLLSFSGIFVWIFWVPAHLMPADPISRHVEDFGSHWKRSEAKAEENFTDLEAMDRIMVPYWRVNSLISPEEREANREESKRRWEEEQEEVFVWWSRGMSG